MKKINIAIDGPSGAGKSSLARRVAAELGYIYVDTGALYRAIGLYMYEHNVDVAEADKVIAALDGVKLELEYRDGAQAVILCGRDVSDEIRLPHVSMLASTVSKIPEVRSFLLDLQRDMAKKNDVIMDGRDIGTVILPDADVKIFLTAGVEGRAKRRYLELLEKGVDADYETVLAEMKERDKQDRERDVAPAVAAEDAVLLDNTYFDLDCTVIAVEKIIEEKINGAKQ